MKYLRKLLLLLRREYSQNIRQYFLYSTAAALVLICIDFLMDAFLPFDNWLMIPRSIMLIPTSLSIFILGYGISLLLHYARKENDPKWKTYRDRFSPNWRIRISLIVGAVLLVVAYATAKGIAYTTVSSAIVAVVIALIAFCRFKVDEAKRSRLGIPDSRDIRYDVNKRMLDNMRNSKSKDRKEKRQEKKSKKTSVLDSLRS